MDAEQYVRLGLAVRSEDKLGENPNGASWFNDTSFDEPYLLRRERSLCCIRSDQFCIGLLRCCSSS